MYKLFATLFFCCLSLGVFSQDISGDWTGQVEFNGTKLGFVFHISKAENGYTATMDIPDQGLHGSKAEQTTLSGSTLSISFPAFQIKFEGILNDKEEIEGTMAQGGMGLPLKLTRGKIERNRPQEPQPPFSYYTEDITFQTSDQLKLEGTLTLPQKDGAFPVVIIISGSGPQNRDGEVFGHKPYLVLADHLTKNGIGVFRYDERGVGKSEGDFTTATLATLTADVESAMHALRTKKDLRLTKLGLIGHSIGGLIAPELASKSNAIDFIVLMAAPGVDGDQLMLSQKATLERGMGLNEAQIAQGQQLVKGAYDIIRTTDRFDQDLRDTLDTHFTKTYGGLIPANQRKTLVDQLTNSEVVALIRAKPYETLAKVKSPVLAINGDKDFQVLAKENLDAIKTAVEKNGNKNVKTVNLENTNHLFQVCVTGLLDEYAKIEQTLSPTVLELITKWIKEQV